MKRGLEGFAERRETWTSPVKREPNFLQKTADPPQCCAEAHRLASLNTSGNVFNVQNQ